MSQFNPAQLARRDAARLATYKANLDFYHGSQWQTASRERQLVFNYAAASIDKVTGYLVQGLGFACYPADAASSEAKAKVNRAEQLWQRVYEQNNLQQLDWETEVDAAVLGDGCYKVTWDVDRHRIRVSSPIASGIFAWWLGDDVSRLWRVASRYQLSDEEVQMLHGISIPGSKAWITELWTDSEFELYLDNERVQSRPNPYGFIPFVIFPNLRQPKKFWGSSDIPPLVEPQRELNRALSQLSRILELSGNPIVVLENVTAEEGIKVQPGSVWALPEDAKAMVLNLLEGSGIKLHIDYIDIIYRALHDLSETPRAAYGGTQRELSGTALGIEMGSLVQKITRKRTIRTSAYHRRNEMILKLAEKYLGEDFEGITHRVVWGPILPADSSRQAQNEQMLVQAGVHSRRTAMDELGVQDPDAEFGRWLEERREILRMNQQLKVRSGRGDREQEMGYSGGG